MRFSLLALTLLCSPLLACAIDPAPLRVAMFSGSKEYLSAKTLPILQQELERRRGTVCRVHFAEDKGLGLPGIDDLENCDVAVLFTRRVTLSDAELAKIRKYCDAGKPVIGIRTASHAFQNWPEIDKQLFGGDYRGHARQERLTEVLPVARDHPVLAGVPAFKTSGKLYRNPQPAADITVLLRALNEDGKLEPIAWTREQRGGRIFYTSLGVPADFENPSFLRLLTNAILWTAKRPLPSAP